MDTRFPSLDVTCQEEQRNRPYRYQLRCQECNDTYRPDEEYRCDVCGETYCYDCDSRHRRKMHPVADHDAIQTTPAEEDK